MPFISEDGTNSWKPSKKQEEFIRIPHDVFEALYGGAAGGGKSELALVLPIIYNFHLNPRFQGIAFRRTFRQLEESLIPRSIEYYRPCGATYNEQKKVWTFPSGARIFFGYMDSMEDARQHDSAEYQYVAFDELTHFEEAMYTYLLSRVRSSDPALPRIVRSFSNPGNVGHAWVRDRFIIKAPRGGKLIYDALSKTYRIFIQAFATDNPYLLNNDPNYYDRLRLLPIAEQKAKIEGDWYSFAGQVFSEFRPSHNYGEPENAIHVISPFKIPDWWPKIMAGDWGYTARTWVGWAAISPEARVILYREYECSKKSIKEWGADVARIGQYDGDVRARFLDPSAWKEEGHEHNIAAQIMAATGAVWEKANNDRLSGKLLLHDLLRWTPKPVSFFPPEQFDPELEARLLRFKGSEAAHEYRALFEPEPLETNLPRLQIFNTCPAVISTIERCVYDEDARGRKIEDVKEFVGDDPYDGLRYLVKGCDRYISDAKQEAQDRERLSQLLKLQDTDMTAFYRAMEVFDHETSTGDAALVSKRMAKRLYN